MAADFRIIHFPRRQNLSAAYWLAVDQQRDSGTGRVSLSDLVTYIEDNLAQFMIAHAEEDYDKFVVYEGCVAGFLYRTGLEVWMDITHDLFIEGSVLFADSDGRPAEDNDNFFWDDTTNRLAIGKNTSINYSLDVVGSGYFTDNVYVEDYLFGGVTTSSTLKLVATSVTGITGANIEFMYGTSGASRAAYYDYEGKYVIDVLPAQPDSDYYFLVQDQTTNALMRKSRTIAEVVGDLGIGSFTEGSVLFASADGTITENNNHFFWNNTTDSEELTITGDITILGNITQNGSNYITHAEHIQVESNTWILNYGETGAGITNTYAGTIIERGTLANYYWGFDEVNDTFVLGQIGIGEDETPFTSTNLQSVLTRPFSADLTNDGIFVWDSTEVWAYTYSHFTYNDSDGLKLGIVLLENDPATKFLVSTTGQVKYRTPASVLLDITNGAFTEGSVLFADADGRISEDNDNLFWDASGLKIGIIQEGLATDDNFLVESSGVVKYRSIDSIMDDFELDNDEWLYSYDYAGNKHGLIKVSTQNLVTFGFPVDVRQIYSPFDAGIQTLAYMPVRYAPYGELMQFQFGIGGSYLFKIGAYADGAGWVYDHFVTSEYDFYVSENVYITETLTVDQIDNATGDFLTAPTGGGLVTMRTAAEVLTDIGGVPTTRTLTFTQGAGITVTNSGSAQDLSANRSWTIDCTITQYTDEMAQDAIGAMIADTTTIDLTYTDATPELKADLKNTSVVAGSYGDSTTVSGFTVDAQGRLTEVTEYSLNWDDFTLANDEWLLSHDYVGNEQGLIRVNKYNVVEFGFPVNIDPWYEFDYISSNYIALRNASYGDEHGFLYGVAGETIFKVIGVADGAQGIYDAYVYAEKVEIYDYTAESDVPDYDYRIYSIGGVLYYNGSALATGSTVTGSEGRVPRFTSTNVLGNGTIRDNGTYVAIGDVINTSYKLYVYGDTYIDGDIFADNMPDNTAAVSNQFFTAYNSATGAFTQARPTWANIDKTTSDIADITTKSHTSLTDIGTNTHAQIDTHIGDSDIHVDHTTVSVIAGSFLSGGGTIDDDITLNFELLNDTYLTTYDYAGNSANLIAYSKYNTVVFGARPDVRSLYVPFDAGMVNIGHIPLRSSSYGDEMGFQMMLAGEIIFKASGYSDGAGGAYGYYSQLYNLELLDDQITFGGVTYTLPTGDGENGWALGTDGYGTLTWIDATGGGGITQLNTLTASIQTLASANDTNITLSIGSDTATHTFTVGWASTLAATRGGFGADVSSYTGLAYMTTGTASFKTIGIANDNIVEVDGTVAAGRYAIWTGNGLDGRTTAQVLSDIGASPVPTDDILDWSTNKYTPFAAGSKASGRLYLADTTPPSGTTAKLGYDGIFYATQLYEATNRVALIINIEDETTATSTLAQWQAEDYNTATQAAIAAFVLANSSGGTSDHGSLLGLSDDDHLQYARLNGRASGQTLYGGTAANDDLILQGTSHATTTSSYVSLQPNGAITLVGGNLQFNGSTNRKITVVNAGAATGYDLTITSGQGTTSGGSLYLNGGLNSTDIRSDIYLNKMDGKVGSVFVGGNFSADGSITTNANLYTPYLNVLLTGIVEVGSSLEISSGVSETLFNSTVNMVFHDATYSDDILILYSGIYSHAELLYAGNTRLETTGEGVGVTGVLTSDNDVEGFGTFTASDSRLKKDISSIEDGLSLIMKMNPVYYTWKKPEIVGERIGFIAQEAMEIIPQMVKTRTDGYLSIDYGQITPILTRGMQELNEKVETVQEKIKRLEQENIGLKQRIENLEHA